MKKLISVIAALFAAVMLCGVSVCAQTGSYVMDNAELLDDYEFNDIEAKLADIHDTYGYKVMIHTDYDWYGSNIEYYAETLAYDYDIDNGMIYVITMGTREYDIYSKGQMYNEVMIGSIIRDLADDLQPYLTDGDYYAAFDQYAARCVKEIEHVNANGPNVEPSYAVPVGVGLGIIISLIVVLVLKHGMNTVRPEKMADNYIRMGSFQLTHARDVFLYSTVRRVKRESSSGSRGGGGGGGHASGSF